MESQDNDLDNLIEEDESPQNKEPLSFEKSEIEDINRYFDKALRDVREDNPDLTPYEQFVILETIIPQKISAEAQERAIEGFVSQDPQVSSAWANALFYLNLKTFLTVTETYADIMETNIDDLFQSVVLHGLSGLRSATLPLRVPVSQYLIQEASRSGVKEHFRIEADIGDFAVTRERLKIFNEIDIYLEQVGTQLGNMEIIQLSKKISSATGLKSSLIKNYINHRYNFWNRDASEKNYMTEEEALSQAFRNFARVDLAEMMYRLRFTESEKEVLISLYGLIDGIPSTHQEEADRQGLSRTRVQQKEEAAFKKIRNSRYLRILRGHLTPFYSSPLKSKPESIVGKELRTERPIKPVVPILPTTTEEEVEEKVSLTKPTEPRMTPEQRLIIFINIIFELLGIKRK